MQYLVRCECGRQLVVTEGVPGLTVTCGCGRVLRLSEGRREYIADTASEPGEGSIADFWRTLYRLTPRCLVTPTLFWLNIGVFAVMVFSGVPLLSPTNEDLVNWGANYGPLTMRGEYWRLLTCTFIHIGLIHLAMNCWALWSVGFVVERLVGSIGFLILYIISGLLGSIAMLWWNPLSLSAGASGAIFGVFGALFGFAIRQRDTLPAAIVQSLRSSAISFIVINIIFALTVPGIGVAGHLGGLIAGICCGLALSQPVVPESRASRPLRNVLVAVGGALAIAIAFSLLPLNVRQEFELFAEHEKKAVETFNDAIKRAEDGKISREELANIVEQQALPEWRKLTEHFTNLRAVPDGQQATYQLFLTYVTARQRSWELLVESIRENDPNKERQSQMEAKQVEAAIKKLSKKVD